MSQYLNAPPATIYVRDYIFYAIEEAELHAPKAPRQSPPNPPKEHPPGSSYRGWHPTRELTGAQRAQMQADIKRHRRGR